MKRSHTSRLKCPRVREGLIGFTHSGPAWITLASVGMDLLEEHLDPTLQGAFCRDGSACR